MFLFYQCLLKDKNLEKENKIGKKKIKEIKMHEFF